MDTQEMYSIEEAEHKKFKSETLLKVRDLETKVEELLYENHKLNEMKEQLEKKCQDLQVSEFYSIIIIFILIYLG